MLANKQKISDALIEFGKRRQPIDVTPKQIFSQKDANQFFVSVLFGYQITWGQTLEASKQFVTKYGSDGNDFWKNINNMELEELRQFILCGTDRSRLHRFYNKMADRMKLAANRMMQHYHSDPRKIWQNQISVKEVKKRLIEFSGIGPELSRMAVLILVRDYKKIGGETSYCCLDPKLDIHVKRVFKRTGLIDHGDNNTAIDVARGLNPEFPAILDYPAWKIGQEFCHEKNPKCVICNLGNVCKKYI